MATTNGPLLSGVTGRFHDRTLQKIRFNANVTQVTLLMSDFNNAVLLHQVVDLFTSCQRRWTEISMIDCSGPLEEIMDFVDSCKVWKICGMTMTESLAESLRRRLGAIEELQFKEGSISEDCMRILGDGLSASSSLQRLAFGSGLLREGEEEEGVVEVLANALRQNSSLKILNLFGCNLEDHQIARLVTCLPDCLEELYMGRNPCRMAGIGALCDRLVWDSSRLVKLDVLYEQTGFNEEGLVGFPLLASALERNRSLQMFNLAYSRFHEADWVALSKALTMNTTLKQFVLRKTLRLSGDHQILDPRTSGMLLRSIRANVTLEFLRLPEILPREAMQEIQHYMVLNRGGRRLLQAENVPLGLWAVAIERVTAVMKYEDSPIEKSACIIYELLRGPALLER